MENVRPDKENIGPGMEISISPYIENVSPGMENESPGKENVSPRM